MNTTRYKTIKIMHIPICRESRKEILEKIQKYLLSSFQKKQNSGLKGERPFLIFTPNPEQVVFASGHPWFRDLLKSADLTIPDGIGLLWASRVLGKHTISERISGVSLFEDLVVFSQKYSVPTGLIGGRAGVADKALECLMMRYPKLTGWAHQLPDVRLANGNGNKPELLVKGGDGRDYIDNLALQIIDTETRLVGVALGAPKQELFIEALSSALIRMGGKRQHPAVLMAVGGALDEYAGAVSRCPQNLDRIGLKWLWRLIHEPWRWRRQTALLVFVKLILIERFRNPQRFKD